MIPLLDSVMENTEFTILLTDNDEETLQKTGEMLRSEGYQVVTARSGEECLDRAVECNPDLILLEVMLDDMNGVDTCKELKKIPLIDYSLIVFLTSQRDDFTQVIGLEAGADDFIVKPVKSSLLKSKIRSLLKRQQKHLDREGFFENEGLVINKEQYSVVKDGKNITLPRKEFELLNLLASRAGKVFTRKEIILQLWPNDHWVGDRTIDVHIRKIRARTGIHNLLTLKGVGYKFVRNVREYEETKQ
ncbi:MAG: response regulator transcription factor, partial [Bacteroidota bacterium]|nr:response regulator transcription factor [Bacteroidota bacterium]